MHFKAALYCTSLFFVESILQFNLSGVLSYSAKSNLSNLHKTKKYDRRSPWENFHLNVEGLFKRKEKSFFTILVVIRLITICHKKIIGGLKIFKF